MKKYNIYLLVPVTDRWDGVKTFVTQFKDIMGSEYFNVHIVEVNNCVENKIGNKLKKLIPNRINNYVFVNFWPASIMVLNIRKFLPLCKIVLVVHDLPWLTVFNGKIYNFLSSSAIRFDDITNDKLRKFLYYSTIDEFKAFNGVDKIVCLCKDMFDLLISFYGISVRQIALICNAIPDYNAEDCICFDKIIQIDSKKSINYLLFIGRPTMSKGWDKIIEIANDIKELDVDYKIICAGSDRFKDYIPATLLDIFEDVGILDQKEILQLIKFSDGILIPSRHEQCSYVGIESLMMGKEVFVFGGFGILNMFNSENSHIVNDFKDIMESLILKKGNKGRLDYLNKYVPAIFKESYTRLLISMS